MTSIPAGTPVIDPQPSTDALELVDSQVAGSQADRHEGGWCYNDAAGVLHGPFSLGQLRGWQGVLPPDLALWRYDSETCQYSSTSQPLQELFGCLQPGEPREQASANGFCYGCWCPSALQVQRRMPTADCGCR